MSSFEVHHGKLSERLAKDVLRFKDGTVSVDFRSMCNRLGLPYTDCNLKALEVLVLQAEYENYIGDKVKLLEVSDRGQ